MREMLAWIMLKEIIFFWDVDDELEPRYLEEMIKAFEDNPEVDVVVSNLQKYWHSGRIKKFYFMNLPYGKVGNC